MPAGTELKALLKEWGGRPSVAVIDLDQLAQNIATLRAGLKPDTRFMAVVKADGYGHGAVPIGKAAVRAGVDELAVATVEEGVRLRQGGVKAPILVLGPIGRHERARAISNDLSLVIADAAFLTGLAEEIRTVGRKTPVDVHLKIDTGMRRFGVSADDAVALARAIEETSVVRLAGVMTHFASADDPYPDATRRQAEVFDACCDSIRAAGIGIPSEHLCNSAATLTYPEYHRDRVRIGIAMYGLRPDPELMPVPEPVRPIMTVHSRVSRVVDLAPGDRVSYGGTWEATSSTRVGLIPIGYADGYRRQGSNLAWMDVSGHRAPVRGRICMDQTLVEILDDVSVGEIVTVIGNGVDGNAPTIDELAVMYGTISHELATNYEIQRLVHLYVQDGELVAINDLSGYREFAEGALTQPEPSDREGAGVSA